MLRRLQPTAVAAATGLVIAVLLPAQPVSYSREVAPILAMNCHGCHGANPESVAARLSTRTWADLNKGGNLGAVIMPGNPDGSPLYQFVSGARGEPHRMPLGGPPLAGVQVDVLKRWILAGAGEDPDTTRTYRLDLPAVRLNRSTPLRIAARIPSTAYIELELSDSQERTLYREGGAVKAAKDSASIGVTGQWIHWDLRLATGWPEQVRARLTIRHAVHEPEYAVVAAGAAGVEFPAGEVEHRILRESNGGVLASTREPMRDGLPDFGRWKKGLAPNWYVLHMRHAQKPAEAAFLFRVAEGEGPR
jgi:hypothetical protein